jgi:hypothetical protein
MRGADHPEEPRMLDVVFVDTDRWRLSTSLLGIGPVKATSADGATVIASRAEKDHIQALTRELVARQDLSLEERHAVKQNMYTDVCAALHRRAVEGEFSLQYQVVFTANPQRAVENYLDAHRRHGHKRAPQS